MFAVCLSLAEAQVVRVSSIQSNGWVHIQGETEEALITLEASSNLVHWESIAVLHGYGFEFADPVSPKLPQRFYRFSTSPLTPTNDWKNQVAVRTYFYDKFAVSLGGDYYVKFAITTNEPARVYYADGKRFLLHYDFASARLDPFIGFTQDEFEEAALYNDGRQIIVGAVIFPGFRAEPILEYGIQFVSRDPLPRELVRDLFELVKSTVSTESHAFYIPAFEQFGSAETNRLWFETNGIPIATTDRWTEDNTCYVLGWALGTLKFLRGSEISAAYADGRLLPQDILLTDAVPSELPYVAGIITLAPSTPNSHVAILARSYGIPFVHLLNPGERQRVLGLVGGNIALQVFYAPLERSFSQCSVHIFNLDPDLDPALKAEILALKNAVPVNITPVARFGAYTAATDNLVPADIRFFGGKAANYGLLRRTIPSNAPVAIAISFDLWSDFMNQTLAGGKTLGREIADRLGGYQYPEDI
ncbi:MAG TPA: PEP-utilizing enzyme, partial [Candidatus Binatia bacterium]|nr:PEP-utilizing enzyme [Candidatus Binatia bacterium]